MEPYVAEIMKHANLARNSAENESMAEKAIEMTDDWYDQLKLIPFVSCKLILFTNFVQSARETPFTC